MDAHITRQRLGNQLSYDWLKILVAVAAAVAAVAILFTMIATRPTNAQQYFVYSYGGLHPAQDNNALPDNLKDAFSYDVLETNVENFDAGAMGNAVFTARRGVLEGSAIFVSDFVDGGGEGATPFSELVSMGIVHRGQEDERLGLFLDAEKFLSDCESYLARFFGENWREAPVLDEEEVRACFLARNGEDKRFKTEEQKEQGVALERERLTSLREDYLVVDGAMKSGMLSFATYRTDPSSEEGGAGKEYAVGFSLGKLSRLNRLYYYYDGEGKQATEKIAVLLFENGEKLADLKYESVTFLRYLLEHYQ